MCIILKFRFWGYANETKENIAGTYSCMTINKTACILFPSLNNPQGGHLYLKLDIIRVKKIT